MISENQIVDSINSFAIKLFKSSADKNNMAISPLSVAMVLYPLWEGAGGNTKSQMEEMLNLGGIKSEIKQYIKTLIESFSSNNASIELKLANSIWLNANKNISTSKEFLKEANIYYKNEINIAYFDNTAVKKINDWVRSQTNGKIQEILSGFSINEIMILINAIYFKGDWTNGFDPENTAYRKFYLLDGARKKCPLMQNIEEYAYFKNNQVQVVKLPYGDERRPEAFMYVILPSKDSSLNVLCENLNYNNLSDWLSKLSPHSVHLKLPKFTVNSDVNLKNILSQWIPDAFDVSNADFSGININACIGRVLQKTFIEINEEGSEAAGSTAVTMVAKGISSEIPALKPASMDVNRPFIYIIQHVSGVILFAGQITDPQS